MRALRKIFIVALSRRCSAVVAVAGHFSTSAEMSGPKDRSVRTYGPNCLAIRIELSRCRSALVPKCLGSELSWVRCARKPNWLLSWVTFELISQFQYFITWISTPNPIKHDDVGPTSILHNVSGICAFVVRRRYDVVARRPTSGRHRSALGPTSDCVISTTRPWSVCLWHL